MKEEDKNPTVDNLESLGAYLKMKREQLGFSLQDVSSKTKINIPYLEYIENENYISLPNEVFIKGFLRSYAKVLGVPESEVLRRYQQWKIDHQAPMGISSESRSPQETKPHRARWMEGDQSEDLKKKWIMYGLSAVGILIVLMVLFSKKDGEEGRGDGSGSAGNRQAGGTVPAAPLTVAPATAVQAAVEPPKPREPSRLTIIAIDRSWVSVVIDDGVTKEFSLHPSDEVTVIADKKFLLNIGNAGGVKVSLNGKPVGPFGKKGQIVRGIKLETD
ncbi:MAG TPA: RodZ domain-containing protein [Nitrospiria bacterium]|nr:RodZ domain-containing protein [Nitrospiria bacterium]